MASITRMVKGTTVTFKYYRDKELWYELSYLDEEGETRVFTFPVPIDNCGSATFNMQDKAMLFMRWIRKHKELVESDDTHS
jgi:hypothetical protein